MLAAQLTAQEDEDAGGPLVRLLENTLSNDSRNIQVVGLSGALSSRATIEKLVVSDPDGPWLTLSGAVLDWNRLALIRGRFSVNTLSADRIEIARAPLPDPNAPVELPDPEAQPFALPDLPVAIEISAFDIGEILLGEELLGTAAELAVNGKLNLAGGALDTALSVNRLDRVGDALTLNASYANETRTIGLDVTLTEAEGGLLSNVLNIPDRPSVVFTAKGEGPVEDFLTDIALSTNGVRRVGGEVELLGLATDGGDDGLGFRAELSGDLRPLMQPDFHAFFGADTALDVAGSRGTDGRLTIDTLSLASQAMIIDGDLAIAAGGAPERVRLTGAIQPLPGQSRIVLPVTGGQTTIEAVHLDGSFDAAVGEGWALTLDMRGLNRPDITLDDVTVRGAGQIEMQDGAQMSGTVSAAVQGLAVPDPTLSDAIGTDITLDGAFDLPGDGTLGLNDFVIAAAGLRATATARINGLNSGFELNGQAQLDANDLSRFAALAGRPLSGAISASLEGRGAPLGGQFDLVANGSATDLRVGVSEADALLAGETMITLDAARGANGISLRRFEIDGAQVSALGSGAVRTTGTTLDFDAELVDLGLLVPQYPGAATLTAALAQSPQTKDWKAAIQLDGPEKMFADIDAELGANGDVDANYAAELPALERFVPQLEGPVTLAGQAQRNGGTGAAEATLRVDGPDALLADVAAQLDADGIANAHFSAALSKLEAFVPQLIGPATFEGNLTGDVNAQAFEGVVRVEGPSALAADLNGSFAMVGPTDLRFEAVLGELERFVPQLVGLAKLDGSLERRTAQSDWVAQVEVAAPEDFSASLNGTLAENGDAAVTYRAAVPKLETFVSQLPGAARLNGAVQRDTAQGTWAGTVRMDAPQDIFADIRGIMTDASTAEVTYLAELPQTEAFVPQLVGASRVSGQINRDTGQDWAGHVQVDAPASILADIRGTLTAAGIAESTYFAQVPRVELFVPQLAGEARVWGNGAANLNRASYTGVLRATAPQEISANIEGSYAQNGPASLTYRALVPQLETFVAQLPGLLHLSGDVNRSDDGRQWIGTTTLSAPGDIRADVNGAVEEGGTIRVTYDAEVPRLQAFVPQLPGLATLNGQVNRDASGTDWSGDLKFAGPGDIRALLDGALTDGGGADIKFDATMPRTERLLPGFPGTLTAQGSAQRQTGRWTVDVSSQTPASGTLALTGTYDEATTTADMRASGQVQLAAANSFIQPNSLEGPLQFDLAVQGPPELNSVQGNISMSGVTIAVPQIKNAIEAFGGAVTLNGGQASVALAGDLRTGGGFRIDGPVQLQAPFNGTIDMRFLNMILTDQVVYETIVNGGVRVAGPLTGNATLSGQIDIGETEINVARAGGAPGVAPIPDLIHEGESAAVYQTRAHAGMVAEETENRDGGGPAIALDLVVSMPNKIFVRGRGLDAELGGSIKIEGTTANIRPSGEISLIRGRLDFLTRRLELTKGVVSLLGTLEPFLEFAATTETSEGAATLLIEGPATAPEITVTSDPERPTEEALAMLVFGDQFTNLSPLKVAQLAAGFARLTGSGGSLTDGARSGLGLSNLDLTTDDEGNAAVGAGAYLSDNIYTDVIVNTQGDTELNINLDVTQSFTLKGSVDNEGDTSVGMFFERDY